jgi:hypothetical protein
VLFVVIPLVLFGVVSWATVVYMRSNNQTNKNESDDPSAKNPVDVSSDASNLVATGNQADTQPPVESSPTTPADSGQSLPSETMPDLNRPIDDDGFVSLFDGKTLDGWQGDPRLWKVIDGAIVGESSAGAGYLVSRRQYKNFVLKLKFKLHRGNSGINFRSQPNPQRPNGMIGSQAEICHVRGLRLLKGKDLVTGAIYGEGNRRGVIADMPESLKPRILASTRKVDWSDYVITALGDRIVIRVNGYTTIDFRDAKGEKEGHFGFQLHSGGTKISFKDLFIKELPE